MRRRDSLHPHGAVLPGERAHLLGRIRRQSAELMMLLLRTGDSKDTALVDLAKRLGNVK